MDTPTTPTDPSGYPRPDRSDFVPNVVRTADNHTLDIGWSEGVLRDGRPYRIEAWAADGITSLTCFFSTFGLDALTDADCGALLEREGLLRFDTPERWVTLRPFTDASGHRLWSANVVVGDEEQIYVSSDLLLLPYAAPAGEPDAG